MSRVNSVRVCDASPNVVLDVAAACQLQRKSANAPIDDYYDAAEAITLVGSQTLLQNMPVLGRLLLLGHVSATETFTRTILARLLGVCPLAKSYAGTQVLPFASIAYYGVQEAAYGLFDGISLAGAPEVKKVIKKLTDLDIPGSGAIGSALGKFDALCHLRHAAVHAHGSIGSGNATALGLANSGGRITVDINLSRLHESAMICRSVVQELNQFLFERTLARWVREGLLAGDYAQDRELFVSLYAIFRSRKDAVSRNNQPKSAYGQIIDSGSL